MTKIAIRADGGSKIGLGHIQRCLALSSQLRKEGMEVLFITKKNKVVKEKIEQGGFKVVELEHNLNLEEDLQCAAEILKTKKIEALITDSYEFDERYLTEVKKNIRMLVSIDDLAEIAFPSDIVINQNIYAKDLEYRSLTGKTEFLLGPRYAFLREEFTNLGKRKINEKVQNILITLGGSDLFNLTPDVLNVLDKVETDFSITVVIGHFFNNISEIQNTVKKVTKKVELIYSSSEMANLMVSSDLAITGGGTTLYELAVTGTRALAFCLADYQDKIIKRMVKAGILIDIGWGNKWKEERLYKEASKLIEDCILRIKMSKLAQELVDGKGCQKMSEIILREFQERIVCKSVIQKLFKYKAS